MNREQLLERLKLAIQAGDLELAESLDRQLSAMPTTDEKRRQVSSGATLKLGPFDTGVRIPQAADEFLAGFGRRMTEIGTLGMADTRSGPEAELLDKSLPATAGSIAGDVASLAAGGGALGAASKIMQAASAAPRAASALGTLGRQLVAPTGFKSAGLTGLGYGAATTPGTVEDRVGAGLATAAGGMAGQALLRAPAYMMHHNVDPVVKELAERGVRLTPGQIIGGKANAAEQAAMYSPIYGGLISNARQKSADDAVRAIYDYALEPINAKVSATGGRDMASEALDEVGKVYDRVVPKLVGKLDSGMKGQITKIRNSLPNAVVPKFDDLVERRIGHFVDGNGKLDVASVLSELKRDIRHMSNDKSFESSSLREAADKLVDVIERNAGRNTKPKVFDEYQRANLSRAMLERIGRASERADDGMFSPKQLLSEIRRQEGGRLNFRRGDALMQDFVERIDPVVSTKFPSRTETNIRRVLGGALPVTMAAVEPMSLAAYGSGLMAVNPVAQRALSGLLLHESSDPLVRAAADAMRRAAPYAGGAGLMAAPTLYEN